MKIIHHHLGLGDHIICNGLVNKFSMEDQIILPCKEHNRHSVKYLYSENTNVTVCPILGDEFEEVSKLSDKFHAEIIRTGWTGGLFWDKSFYTSLGLDFNLRWSMSKIPLKESDKVLEIIRDIVDGRKIILVNDKSSDNIFDLNISRHNDKDFCVIKTSEITNNIFHWVGVIKCAAEIHTIDSAFLHLCESANYNKGNRMIYHFARKTTSTPAELKGNWSYVYY